MRNDRSGKNLPSAFFFYPGVAIFMGACFSLLAIREILSARAGTLWPVQREAPGIAMVAGVVVVLVYGAFALYEGWKYDQMFLSTLAVELLVGMYVHYRPDLSTPLRTTLTALYLVMAVALVVIPFAALLRKRMAGPASRT